MRGNSHFIKGEKAVYRGALSAIEMKLIMAATDMAVV